MSLYIFTPLVIIMVYCAGEAVRELIAHWNDVQLPQEVLVSVFIRIGMANVCFWTLYLYS